LKAEGTKYEKGAFPWAASGRALSVGADGEFPLPLREGKNISFPSLYGSEKI